MSALAIGLDILVRGYRQRMAVMEAVWPITALYFGPAAVWMYVRYGRPQSSRWLTEHGRDRPPDKARLGDHRRGRQPLQGRMHPGDIIAEIAVFAVG